MSARLLKNSVAFFIGFVFAFSIGKTYAVGSVPAVTHFYITVVPTPDRYTYSTTLEGACSGASAYSSTYNYFWVASGTYGTCDEKLKSTGVHSGYYEVFKTTSCPVNSSGLTGTYPNQTCSCSASYTAVGSSCVITSCSSVVGTTAASGYYDLGTNENASLPAAACYNGCTATNTGGYASATKRYLKNGVYNYMAGPMEYKFDSASTITTCSTTSATPSGAVPAPTCAAGQVLGYVNDQPLCLTSGGEPTNPYQAPAPKVATTTKSTVDNGDGTTTETTTTTYPDGSTKTDVKTTTTATGATSTTSTTSGGAGGAPRMADNNGQPIDKLTGICESNPTLPICKGDMATETTQKQIKDLLNPDTSATPSDMASATASLDAAAASHEALIDSVGAGGSHGWSWSWVPSIPAYSCAPYVMTVQGHVITFDWCEKAELARSLIGYAMYIFTGISLLRIMTGRTEA